MSSETSKAVEQGGYSRSAVLTHWLIALAIFFLFVSSWWMLALPLPSKLLTYRQFPFQLHKNIGITVFVLLAYLAYVRFKYRPPRMQTTSASLRWLAVADHVLLYVLIAACCVSGYLSSSYSGWTTTYWWVLDLPHWGREDEELNVFWSDVHLWTCWGLLAVLSAHIAGAVYHAFTNDGIVRRMIRL